MQRIYKLEESQQDFGERQNPKEFKEIIWKDVSLSLIVKYKGGKQHCSPTFCFYPGGWDIFEIFLNIIKRVHWNRKLRLLCTLCIGVSRKFHLHFTTMLLLRYYKKVQSLCKNWLLVSKITWGIWKTSDKQWKVQKVEIQWATFV